VVSPDPLSPNPQTDLTVNLKKTEEDTDGPEAAYGDIQGLIEKF